jgi:hypothetical protein
MEKLRSYQGLAICVLLVLPGCSDGQVRSAGTGGRGGVAGGTGGQGGGGGSAAGTSGGAGELAAGHADEGGAAGALVTIDAGLDGHGEADAGCFPACIATLTAPCPSSGSCVEAASASPTVSNLCFANGVTIQNVSFEKPNGLFTMETVKTSGGALCYTLEIDGAGVDPIAYDYTWKDANGTVVATAGVNPNAPTIVFINCGSMIYTVDTTATQCAGAELAPPATSSCATGACSF